MAARKWEQLVFWVLSSNRQLQHITHIEIPDDVWNVVLATSVILIRTQFSQRILYKYCNTTTVMVAIPIEQMTF